MATALRGHANGQNLAPSCPRKPWAWHPNLWPKQLLFTLLPLPVGARLSAVGRWVVFLGGLGIHARQDFARRDNIVPAPFATIPHRFAPPVHCDYPPNAPLDSL